MNLHQADSPKHSSGGRREAIGDDQTNVLLVTAWHSFAWLILSNCIGLLLATLLLLPRLNRFLGEWTYGHWALPLHLNLNLYGWCSLPLVALALPRLSSRPPANIAIESQRPLGLVNGFGRRRGFVAHRTQQRQTVS